MSPVIRNRLARGNQTTTTTTTTTTLTKLSKYALRTKRLIRCKGGGASFDESLGSMAVYRRKRNGSR